MSHSIHMLSIQIDTKNILLFNNNKLSFFASEFSIILRLLDTLDTNTYLIKAYL